MIPTSKLLHTLHGLRGQRVCVPFFGALLLVACVLNSSRLVFADHDPAPPSDLRCEYLTNPLGIDVRQPRFSWVLHHSERGQKQTAYQVLVATQEQTLDKDQGDQWDSGKVASDESTHVVYAGKPLASGRTYDWKVRYWDKQGKASAYSRPAHFEMGLLAREEWKGQWIGGANQLRTEFQLADPPIRARAYISGLGYYELRINGKKVGSHVLDPGWTTYDKRILYAPYDVTSSLRRGANARGEVLKRGLRFADPEVGRDGTFLAGGHRAGFATALDEARVVTNSEYFAHILHGHIDSQVGRFFINDSPFYCLIRNPFGFPFISRT